MKKDGLSSKVKKDNCWSDQSPEKLTVLFRFNWATRYITIISLRCNLSFKLPLSHYFHLSIHPSIHLFISLNAF